MSKSPEKVMAAGTTCKVCADGTWECGNPRDLCTGKTMRAADWTLMGTISYDIFTAKVNGEIVVKIEPSMEPTR